MIVVLLAVVAIVSAGPSDQESARIRISQKGLDFGEDIGFYMIEILQKVAVGKLTLPKIASGSFEVSDLQFQKMDLGKPELSIVDNVGVKWRQNSAKIRITGDWAIQTLWWNYGSLNLNADIQLESIAGITASNGKLKTAPKGCNVHFNSFNLDLNNSFFTWIASLMEGSILPEVKNAICSEINKVLATQLNAVITALPHDIPVADLLELHIAADSSPVFLGSNIDISARVEADSQNKDIVFPFHPEPMNDPNNPTQMVCLLLSDYTLNTASYVVLGAGKIAETIPSAEVAPSTPFLNTAYYKTSIPALYSAYPDTALTFLATNTRYPRIQFDQDLIKLEMPMNVTVTPAGATTVVTLSVDMTVEGTVKHDNNKISGSITNVDHVVSVSSSSIGNVDPASLKAVIDGVLDKTVLPLINKVFNKGIVLPLDKYLTLEEGVLEAHDNFVKVCADMTLTDFSLQELKKAVEKIVNELKL